MPHRQAALVPVNAEKDQQKNFCARHPTRSVHLTCRSKLFRSGRHSKTWLPPSAGQIVPHGFFFFFLNEPLIQSLREQTMSMHALIARPVTAPATQKSIPAAGIPTRGIGSPRPNHSASGDPPAYASHTVASSRKSSKAASESSRNMATPRSRSQTSHASSELYALAHDFYCGTASSNAKIVSNQQLQVALGDEMHHCLMFSINSYIF
jgi:hypothetical protein